MYLKVEPRKAGGNYPTLGLHPSFSNCLPQRHKGSWKEEKQRGLSSLTKLLQRSL